MYCAQKLKMKFMGLIIPLIFLSSCDNSFIPDEFIPSFSEYVKDGGTDYLEVMVYGDAGRGNDNQWNTAQEMEEYAADTAGDIPFIINLGDSFYNDGVTSLTDPMWQSHFETIYDPEILNMPFYSVLGNHDYKGNIEAQLNYTSPNNDRWQMPNRYYTIRKTLPDGTDIDFFFLDTERIFYGDAEQLIWLKKNLEDSNARWIIVAGHKPLFNNGEHGPYPALITRLKPLFDNKVDIYICGHEHNMQILKPVNEVYYIINGAASKTDDTQVETNTLFAAIRLGFMTLLMSRDTLVCNVMETDAGLIYSQILKEK
jgi:tartrate-resistant acid phosphatase type 5